MNVRLNPYIGFRDEAREALAFYHSVFGGELSMMTFAEGGMPHDPAEENRIMHGQIDAPNGMTLMISDTPSGMDMQAGSNISISLSGDDVSLLRSYWEKLVADGQVSMPLETAPWGDMFGMLSDRFGITWMVNIAGQGH
ncbi:PhnB protein [Devosia crocina]|uniref:PhnB protein n=1 Tax=Devosia crocina TaxID=429728 RepID=A0A1I7NDP8_9HYPH|nr:VOC family protein [Devosia crocina]SFV32782.1 PhnB protein [Devosia crocina]